VTTRPASTIIVDSSSASAGTSRVVVARTSSSTPAWPVTNVAAVHAPARRASPGGF